MFARVLTARVRAAERLARPFRIIAFLILVTAAFGIPNEADAAFPGQSELDARDLSDILLPGFQRFGVIAGCAVTAQGTPNMTVAVASGTIFLANKALAVPTTTVTIATADSTHDRYDLIVVDSTGTPLAVAGTPAANPVFPAAAGRTVLAVVTVPQSNTAVSATQIVDKRVMLVLSQPGIFNAFDYGAVPDDFYGDAVVPTAPGTKATVATQGILSGTGTGTFTISSGASYPTVSFTMAIDSEAMIGSISGTTVTITQRGAFGTTAVSHSVGASVYEAITSATAAFRSTDVNANVVFLRTGDSNFLDQNTTIRSVLSATAITVNNRSTRSANVYSSIRFYVSRYGDQAAAIQATIDACAAAGGGTALCPGVGYVHNTEFVTKNRVMLSGGGQGATRFHLASGVTAKPSIRNDTTLNNSAMLWGVVNCTVDNNRDRQTALTVTTAISTGASYAVGQSTLDVTSSANLFNGGGVITIGTNKLTYQDITVGGGVSGTDRLTGVTGGQEGSTDATATAGATVTQIKAVGIYCGLNPFNATPTLAEEFDPHVIIRDVRVKYTGGDGIQAWGQSESRWDNVWVESSQEVGFRPSYDSWMTSCTADGCGRMGFLIRGSSVQGSNNKAFFCGGIVAADGYGFMFEGYTGLEAGCKILMNCNTQDNKAGGYRIRNCQRVFITGHADSNGTSSAGTYAALTMEGPGSAGTNGCIIQLMCTDRNSTTFQRNALHIADAGVANNFIVLSHGNGTDSPTVPVGSVLTATSNLTQKTNRIIANGIEIFGGGWVMISKAADTPRSTNATLTADPDLQFAMVSGVTYRIRGKVFFDTAATPDFQYSFTAPSGTWRSQRADQASGAGTVPANRAIDVAVPGATAIAGTGTTGGYLDFDIVFKATASGTFSFNWAQNQSNGSATTVLAGSYIEWMVA